MYELCVNVVCILDSFTSFAHTVLSINKDFTYLFTLHVTYSGMGVGRVAAEFYC